MVAIAKRTRSKTFGLLPFICLFEKKACAVRLFQQIVRAFSRLTGFPARSNEKAPNSARGLFLHGRVTSALRCRRLLIHALAERDAVQLGVGRFFLVEICRQQPDDVVMTQFLGPRDQGAVARNLVMLDGL